MKSRASFSFILLILVLGSSIVTILYLFSERPNRNLNGFNRNFRFSHFQIEDQQEFSDKVLSIYRLDQNNLLIRSITPGKFYITDEHLRVLKELKIDMEGTMKNKFYSGYSKPYIFILSYKPSRIYRVNTNTSQIDSFKIAKLFSPALPIDSNKVVLRMYDSTNINKEFVVIDLNVGIKTYEKNISLKLNDAGMTTEGQLLYDTSTNLITYVFHYGNGYICMDTNLNLVTSNRTIDTFTQFQAKVIRRPNSITHFKPPVFVNRHCATDNGYLFVESGIQADNETSHDFANSSALDIYDLSYGRYLFSFYLPSYQHEKMTRFIVCNNKIIAAYQNRVISYKMPDSLMPSSLSQDRIVASIQD